jgi:short-subunit dehydrogenase
MTDHDMRPFAVVTGGSNGIGFALATELLGEGYDVLIAARDLSHLEDAARRLRGEGGSVLTQAADLATSEGVISLYDALSGLGRPVDILCVNAGIGLGGAFAETDLDRELEMIDLNVRGAVQLTKLVVKDMLPRGSGKLLFTSSIAATMPDPFEAVYGGTKVFLRWFGEALRNELKDSGISVTVLMPGVTDTNFFNRAEMLDTKAGASEHKDDPADVAQAAIRALLAGDDKIVPTLKNEVVAGVADALPDRVSAQLHRGMSEPGSAG